MARKRRRQKRHRNTIPFFLFTPETITLVEKAIALFESPLGRADHQDKKVMFAEETVQQIKAKLANMRQSARQKYLMVFDYNEKIIMTNALLIYSLDVLSAPPSAKRDREVHQCWQIRSALSIATRETI